MVLHYFQVNKEQSYLIRTIFAAIKRLLKEVVFCLAMIDVKKHFLFFLFLWESLAADITVGIGLQLRISVSDEIL
jgi:hypothetical protein